MTSRQAGRRISVAAAKRGQTVGGKKHRGARVTVGQRREAPLTAKERRRLGQLVVCGSVFVLLVAVKLLLPGKTSGLQSRLSGALRHNMDVQAVFSAVGRAASGEADVTGALEEVYQAVFHPQETGEALETVSFSGPRFSEPTALDSLRTFRQEREAVEDSVQEPAADAANDSVETDTLTYVLYSEENLPDHVSLEQALLGFDYCTPVMGTLSSGFGYREHPLDGEERFHYGMDIAANTGTAISCFADGTVTAVGESSSYGKYLIVSHQGGYETLYAHCSKITATSGATVKAGETIAAVGETGMATGPHLHFELHRSGVYLNPVYYVSLA